MLAYEWGGFEFESLVPMEKKIGVRVYVHDPIVWEMGTGVSLDSVTSQPIWIGDLPGSVRDLSQK